MLFNGDLDYLFSLTIELVVKYSDFLSVMGDNIDFFLMEENYVGVNKSFFSYWFYC